MVTRQWSEWRLLAAFKFASDPARFNSEWQRVSKQGEEATLKVMRFWPFLFWPALGFGMAGGTTLSYNALAIVFGWPQLAG